MFSRWVATLGRPRAFPSRSVPSSSPIPRLPPRGALSSGTPGQGRPPPLAFDDGRAFQLKSLWEILRALFVFKFCSYPRLVNSSGKLMSISRKLMGKWLFDRVMKASAYGQFVAGETLPEIQQSLENLSRLGIRPMLAVPIEEDVGNQKSELWYDGNLRKILECVDLSFCSSYRPMMQLKVTALMSADLCQKLTLVLKEVTGVEELAAHRLVEVMDGQDLAFPSLGKPDAEHLRASLRRLKAVGQYAKERGVRVLVDAEYTYLNPALTLVTIAMMMRFNQSEASIWNTYQCYLKDVYRLLSADIVRVSSLSLYFGVKLVRGAYLEKERELARCLGYPDPIQDSWEDTNSSYQHLMDRMLELVSEQRHKYNLVIATHNDSSIKHALNRMQEIGISKDDDSVCFAQLLGMCDHISLSLGTAGYSVYKSIPYGPVDNVLPYLVRRSQENLSVLQGLRTEQDLLWLELRRRLFGKRSRAV